jgi:DNA polymerase-3 subunit delta
MAAMHARDLIAKVTAGELPRVSVIVGSETFFTSRAVQALRGEALRDDFGGLNQDVLEGRGCSAARVIEAARTLPMLAKQRFVLVREVSAMAAAELDKLAEYLAAPCESCCLVLTAEKLDGRTRLAKRAASEKVLVDAAPLRQGDLRGFVTAEARARKLRIQPDAAEALVEAIGSDLPALDDALERLGLYVGERGVIDLNAVESCVTRVKSESIWALVDAVGLRDRATALRATGSLLAEREPPLRILSMVARQLRMVARMKSALAEGMPAQEAVRAAGAPPFKARELAQAAGRMSPRGLTHAFAVLRATDLALKGSKLPPDVALEQAIVELTRPTSEAPAPRTTR